MKQNAILCGDALSVLADFPTESIGLCVTAPSYYCRSGARIPEVWGMENTIEDYVFRIINVVEAVGRALKPTGVLWLVMSRKDANIFSNLYRPLESTWAYCMTHSWTDVWSSVPRTDKIMVFFKSVPKVLPKRKHIKARSTRAIAFTEPQTNKRVGYAAFPSAIPRAAIKAHCPSYGIVLDPFMGQGTTIIEAFKMGRRFVGIEIAPEMCEYVKNKLAGFGYGYEGKDPPMKVTYL